MMHNRRWSIQAVNSVDELADQLLNHSWCGCAGFELDGYRWLNDSTSPDAVQEYAVVRQPEVPDDVCRQVESITVGWCSRQELLDYIRMIHHDGQVPEVDSGPVVTTRSVSDLYQALGDERVPEGIVVQPTVETPQAHGRCGHCA